MDIKKITHKIKKILFAWSLGIVFLWLVWINTVFAQWSGWIATGGNIPGEVVAQQEEKVLVNLAVTLDTFLNFIYIVLRPMLAITGMALDNTLVYWSVFHLDQILRQIWTVVMYLSFIFLWVLIIRDIAKAARSKWDISAIILWNLKNWILAGLLIPLSWFLMGALIDLSTIAIYQIWNIPLTIMGTNSELDQKLLNIHSTMDLNSAISASDDAWFRYSTYYSCMDKKYVPCKQENYMILKTSQENYITQFEQTNKLTTWTINKGYCVLTPTTLFQLEYAGVWTGSSVTMTWESRNKWLEGGKKEMWSCNSIKTIMKSSQTMVWPLYAIYGSLLNFASINQTDSGKSTEAEVVIFLIKSIIWLLLIIPLIGLAVMSIGRVGMLWLAIAFSPLVIMFKLFKDKDNKQMQGLQSNMNFKWWIDAKFDLDNIIKLVFQPVLTVFALGLSLILLSATTSMIGVTNDGSNRLLESLWLEKSIDQKTNSQCLNINNYTTTCVTDFPEKYTSTVFADYFSWIISNIIGILIMWSLLFASMKGNKITDGMVDRVKGIWENFIKNRIPVFGWYSYESMFGDDGISKVFNSIVDKFTEDKTEASANILKQRITNSTDGTYTKVNADIDFKTPIWADGKEVTDTNIIKEAASKSFGETVSKIPEDKSIYIDEKDISNLEKYRKIWWYSWSNLAEYLWDKSFYEFMNASPEGSQLLNKWINMDEKNIARVVWVQNVDKFVANRNNIGSTIGMRAWEKWSTQLAAKISPDYRWQNFTLYGAERAIDKEGKTTYKNIYMEYVSKDNLSTINQFVDNYPYMRDDVKIHYGNDLDRYNINETSKRISKINTSPTSSSHTTQDNTSHIWPESDNDISDPEYEIQ